MAFLPSTELVAVSWLRSIVGIPTNGVATALPGDTATWSDSGFVQVSVVAGNPNAYVPMRSPVVQVDCWANNPNSQKPPWGKASSLAELIVAATYDRSLMDLPLQPATGYEDVRVRTAFPLSEPRRVPLVPFSGNTTNRDVVPGFARVQFDMTLNWTVV